MIPKWPWCGPDGASVDAMAKADPQGRKRSILPAEPYGVLIGAFSDKDAEPDEHADLAGQLASAAFRVGSKYEKKATEKSSGYLYFTVNDVQYGPSPDLFFVDNIGTYYVDVDVSSK